MSKKEIKLFHGNIYKYTDNGKQYIGVYLCDTNLAKKSLYGTTQSRYR